MTIDEMIADVIRREGSKYVNHPADRGGPTKFGVTQATLDRWLGPAGPGNVKAVTKLDAAVIYKSLYYLDPGIDRLPEPWQPLVFDWGVNSGPVTAIKALQKLCHDYGFSPGPIDGIIGPKTIAAAGKILTIPLRKYIDVRRQFYHGIVMRDPSQQVFLAGWLNRVDGMESMLT